MARPSFFSLPPLFSLAPLVFFAALSCQPDSAAPPDTAATALAPPDAGADTADTVTADTATADTATPSDPQTPDTGPTKPDPGPPPRPVDTDRDGILDSAETLDGTDPLDPRSARAWHPELDAHPRLFFGPDDLPKLRQRAAEAPAGDGPLHVLWGRILTRAEAPLPTVQTDQIPALISLRNRAVIAEAAAFVALVADRPDLAQKATQIMQDASPDIAALLPVSPLDNAYDLRESEALLALCSAADYLQSMTTPPADLQAALKRVTERVDTFRDLHFEPTGYRILLQLANNNHAMKMLGAIGVCGMALPNRKEAAIEVNEAFAGLDYLLNHVQGTPDGGYAEGWNYLAYGDQTWLPFVVALHRWLNNDSAWIHGLGLLSPEDPRAGEPHEYLDFVAHPTTQAIYNAALFSTRPDGLMVPVDDANPVPLSGGLVASLFQDGRFLWAWQKPKAKLHHGMQASVTFAQLDLALTPIPPSAPAEAAFPEAGFAILRSGFQDDALFVHLQAEHGQARVNALGHDHADPLSFQVFARGEALILDPGYINWEHHDLVKYGTDHNLILVDGQGPAFTLDGPVQSAAQDDAFITGFDVLASDLSFVSARSHYLGCEVQRTLLRLGDRFVVIADRIRNDTPEAGSAPERQFTLQLNGGGGGDDPLGTFDLLDAGARWTRPLAAITATVRADTPQDLAVRDEEHVITWGSYGTHTVLEVHAAPAQAVGFLTTLRIDAPGAKPTDLPPQVTLLPSGLLKATAPGPNGTDEVFFNRTESPITPSPITAPPSTPAPSSTPTPIPPGLTVRRLDSAGVPTATFTISPPQ